MTAHPERKPDALDLAERLTEAASDLTAAASGIHDTWFDAPLGSHPRLSVDDTSRARWAASSVLAAIDEYEGRT